MKDLNNEKWKVLQRMEEIANSIMTEFYRKDISKEEGIGAVMCILAKVICEAGENSEIAEKNLIKALQEIVMLFKTVEEMNKEIKS